MKTLRIAVLPTLFLFLATVLVGLCLLPLQRPAQRSVSDVLLVVDVTQSMNVKDMQLNRQRVSRLEFAQYASKHMLQRWPCGSKLSVAMFSGHRSFVMFRPVEVCGHHDELAAAIDSLDWRSAWVARSEVAKGLFSAMKVLPEVGEHTRVVFVSDGHEAPPLHERYRPKLSSSIERLGGLIVGLGGSELVRIPKFGLNGESQGFWRASEVMQVDSYRMGRGNGEALAGVDQSDLKQRLAAGREHLSSLKEQHLMSLSSEAGMDYVTVASVEEFERALALPVLWHDIDTELSYSEYLAAAALICLMLRLLLPFLALFSARTPRA